jgi:hypothetical protein
LPLRGLSRRRSRVRVPSLPPRKSLQIGVLGCHPRHESLLQDRSFAGSHPRDRFEEVPANRAFFLAGRRRPRTSRGKPVKAGAGLKRAARCELSAFDLGRRSRRATLGLDDFASQCEAWRRQKKQDPAGRTRRHDQRQRRRRTTHRRTATHLNSLRYGAAGRTTSTEQGAEWATRSLTLPSAARP